MPFGFEQFFNGKVSGEGQLSLFNGRRQYDVRVRFDGRWDGVRKILILDEYLEIDNSENQSRVYRFTKSGSYTWQGACPGDIVGEIEGKETEQELVLNFMYLFPVYGPVRVPVSAETRITTQDKGSLSLVTSLKLGKIIPVGELTLTVAKSAG